MRTWNSENAITDDFRKNIRTLESKEIPAFQRGLLCFGGLVQGNSTTGSNPFSGACPRDWTNRAYGLTENPEKFLLKVIGSVVKSSSIIISQQHGIHLVIWPPLRRNRTHPVVSVQLPTRELMAQEKAAMALPF